MQVESQILERQLREVQGLGETAKNQAQHRLGLRGIRNRRRGEGLPFEVGGDQFERPKRDGIACAEAARLAFDGVGFQRRLRGDRIARGQFALAAIQDELRHGHRRHGALIVRIEHAQHGLGDFGKIVVEFVARAGVQIGERLDQPLDVRIAGRIRA